jgi:hypothetical protein
MATESARQTKQYSRYTMTARGRSRLIVAESLGWDIDTHIGTPYVEVPDPTEGTGKSRLIAICATLRTTPNPASRPSVRLPSDSRTLDGAYLRL